ncbi:MAG: TonB-dependent receptor [Hyphomonadaceae bacterium]|nr:TonB-dependent receptor [Hyphomonadaceae bacterium]
MATRWMVAIGVLAAGPAMAQAPDARGSEDEIVVTAPLEGSRIESLQGAAVLNRDAVTDNLVGGLGETVANLPGVSSSFYGAGASRPVIRGLGDDRVRVLENGIGAIDAASASPDHAPTADGLDAERIEVMRGAAALAYGGNAIGGVINVIDQSIPTRAPENGYAVEGLASWSSVDQGRQGALGLTATTGPLVLRLDVGARETDSYEIPGFARSAAQRAAEPLAPGDVEPQGEAPNSWTSVRSYAAGASLARNWGFAGVAVKQFDTEYGLPPEEAGATIGGHIEMEQTRVETRGDIKVDLGLINRVDFGAQYSDYTHTEFEDTGAAGTTFNNTGFEARLEAHHGGLEGKLKGAFGVQYTDTDFEAIGDEAFITPTSTKDAGAFAIERWDLGGWGLEGGARFERRNLQNALSGDADFDTISGSFGAFMRPAENWFFGATVARTQRAPTGIELYADGPHLATSAYEVGDATLQEETALSSEASLRYTTAKVQFEASLYRAGFEDYIALVPNGLVWVESTDTLEDPAFVAPGEATLPVFAFVARDATFTGGEISLAGELFTAGAWTVRGDIAADYVRANFDNDGPIPRIPSRTVTVGVEGEAGAFTTRLEAVDVAKQDRIAAFETPTDGYTLVNARLTWRPLDGDKDLRISLDGRNLTDEEAREHVSFLKDVLPRPGRSIRIALTAGF